MKTQEEWDRELLAAIGHIKTMEEYARFDTFNYEFSEGKPYAIAIQKLREDCQGNNCQPKFTLSDGSQVYRPLTFQETIEARVTDYNTEKDENGNERSLNDRKRLFNRWNWSCTGIAYKAGSTKFKLILECEQLINIDKDFNENFLPINYDSIQGIELDSSKGIYNNRMTEDQVKNNPAWIEVVQDRSLLNNYVDIVFSLNITKQMMEFWVRQNPSTDELRALWVSNIDNDSYVGGCNYLKYSACFVRRTPVAKP